MVQAVDMNIQVVDLYNQYLKIKPEVDERFQQIFQSSTYINGPFVKQFCSNLANYLKVKHVLPCANGTDALTAALMALDMRPGDEVITVPFTFVATAEAISLLGLKPVFVDVDPDTFNIDANKIEAAITSKTKCILPVHLYGQAADMHQIMQIAEAYDLYVIEDNAQAIGAQYCSNGTKGSVGTLGHIGCTSFYPSKNLGAYGDAGAMFTNDDELAERLTAILNHGQAKKKYYSEFIGLNSRLDSFQAAILGIKLQYLDDYIAARRHAADFYDVALATNGFSQIPVRSPQSSHVFHQYTIKVQGNRDELRNQLSKNGVPSMVYYPQPLHMHIAYRYLGYKQGDFPVTEYLAKQVISLPMHTELTTEQLTYICERYLHAVKKVQ